MDEHSQKKHYEHGRRGCTHQDGHLGAGEPPLLVHGARLSLRATFPRTRIHRLTHAKSLARSLGKAAPSFPTAPGA